jgi:hypothetical protein
MDQLDQVFATWDVMRNIGDRIDYLSHYFLGRPYIVNPQGEGDQGEIDRAPLYRFDGFDCVTFVNNILALSRSNNMNAFQHELLKINYYNSIPRFENRFHFMSVDWNPQNQKNNILKEVTETFLDKNNQKIAVYAEGDIDKPGWFLKRSENASVDQANKLREYAKKFKIEFVRLPYLPLSTLLDSNKNPNDFIFNQVPHASVIEIVRPNWNLKEKIGTNLHVSHVGFAIRKNDRLYFRHASSEEKCVVEILLSDYLKNYLDSATIKGIHVQAV